MSTVMPQSELMRKAVAWVNEQLAQPGSSLTKLLDDAGMRFNLGPKEQEFLRSFFSKSDK